MAFTAPYSGCQRGIYRCDGVAGRPVFSGIHIVLKCLLIFAVCLFPLIQPLVVYLRARKQAKSMPKNVHLEFDDKGMHVSVGDQKEDIDWDSVAGITKKPTLMVVFSSARHGYLLTNKMLGEQKEDFYKFILSKLENRGAGLLR